MSKILLFTIFCVAFHATIAYNFERLKREDSNPINPGSFLNFMGQQPDMMKDFTSKVTDNKQQFEQAMSGIKEQMMKGARDLKEKIDKAVNIEEKMQ